MEARAGEELSRFLCQQKWDCPFKPAESPLQARSEGATHQRSDGAGCGLIAVWLPGADHWSRLCITDKLWRVYENV